VSLLFYFLEAQRLLKECFEELSGRRHMSGEKTSHIGKAGF